MANVGTLEMRIEANTDDFERGIDSSKRSLNNFGRNVGIAAVAAGTAIAGIGAASIRLAQEQEFAEARLESIAKTVAGASDQEIESLKRLAAETQSVTTFGDEVLIAGQSQLLSFGIQAKAAEQLTGSLADLLAATVGITASQDDAINAANLLGKAFSGQPGALSRVGILLNDTQSEILKTGTSSEKTAALVEILNQNYGGLAETLAETSSGKIQQIKNIFGDIGEEIGFALLPYLDDFSDWLIQNLPNIQEGLAGALEDVGDAVGPIADAIRTDLIPALGELEAAGVDIPKIFGFLGKEAVENASVIARIIAGIAGMMGPRTPQGAAEFVKPGSVEEKLLGIAQSEGLVSNIAGKVAKDPILEDFVDIIVGPQKWLDEQAFAFGDIAADFVDTLAEPFKPGGAIYSELQQAGEFGQALIDPAVSASKAIIDTINVYVDGQLTNDSDIESVAEKVGEKISRELRIYNQVGEF